MCRTNFWRKKERRRIIITRFDCVWMQTQKSPNDPHIRIWACGYKFHHYQPIPHFKILLDINFHWNRRPLTIWRPTMDINLQHHNLLGNQISSQSEDFCILVQHVLLPVTIHFHWNHFIFEFLTIFLIFILAAILKIPRLECTSWDGDPLSCEV
jgi:hypothetical protein